MKFFVILSIFFFSIYFAQSHNLKLNSWVFHDYQNSVNGELRGKLFGKTETYPFSFETKVFEDKQKLYTEIEFPEKVESINVTWVTESDVTLEINSIQVTYNNQINYSYFHPEEDYISKGETIEFFQNS